MLCVKVSFFLPALFFSLFFMGVVMFEIQSGNIKQVFSSSTEEEAIFSFFETCNLKKDVHLGDVIMVNSRYYLTEKVANSIGFEFHPKLKLA